MNTLAEPAGAFTDDGRWFIARAGDGQFDLFDMATGARLPFRLPVETTFQGKPRVSGAFRVQPNPNEKGSGLLWRPLLISNDDRPGGVPHCIAYLQDLALRRMFPEGYTAADAGACESSPDHTRVALEVSQVPRGGGLLGRVRAQLRKNEKGVPTWIVLDISGSSTPVVVATLQRTADSDLWDEDARRSTAWSADGRFIVIVKKAFGGHGSFGLWRADTGQPVDFTKAGVAGGSFLGFVSRPIAWLSRLTVRSRVIAADTLQAVFRFPVSAAGPTANAAAMLTGLLTGEVNLATNQSVWVGPDSTGVLWIRSPKDGATARRAPPAGKWRLARDDTRGVVLRLPGRLAADRMAISGRPCGTR